MLFVNYIEDTPNPNALKYVLNEVILTDGYQEFSIEEKLVADNMAKEIFEIQGISKVFYKQNYITVIKDDSIQWEEIENPIKEIINAHIENVEFKAKKEKPRKSNKNRTELIKKIDEILDETIKPALAMDGGGLEVVDVKDDMTVIISYQGACGSCPSATTGTLMAIERILQENLDDNITVEAFQ